MPTPTVERRTGDIRIWIISLLFLLFIVSGGAFLAMYIALPESKNTAWYPVAGMVLVAIPWLFWLLTFMYRCSRKGDGDAPSTPKPPSSVTSPASASEPMRNGPDGTWPAGEPQGEVEEQGRQEKGERTEKEGDSRNSHESELPLALSMSIPT